MASPALQVSLSIEDWQKVLTILAQAPWTVANPLIMAIGDQVRREASEKGVVIGEKSKGNGAEASA